MPLHHHPSCGSLQAVLTTRPTLQAAEGQFAWNYGVTVTRETQEEDLMGALRALYRRRV